MQRATWLALAASLFGSIVALPARAEPRTAGAIQLGLGFRYGIEQNEGDFNPWGLGLGLEGGYTLDNSIYVGGNFDYFFGEKLEDELGSVEGNLWQLMAEGGYDLGLLHFFVLRPKLGLGVANWTTDACVDALGCTKNSGSDLALAPGVKLMLFTPIINVSFDTRYVIVLSEETSKALVFSAGIGF